MTGLIQKREEGSHIVYRVCGIKFKFRNTPLTKKEKILKLKKQKIKYNKFLAKFQPCKKYKYIIPFGMNCDFALMFLEYFEFSDSTFWNWVFACNPKTQIEVMKNYDILFSQGLDPIINSDNMYICKKTKFCLHGKDTSIKNPDGSINEEKLKAGKEELLSRMRYLYEKTNRYLASDEKKLIAFTIVLSDVSCLENLAHGINELYEYLLTRTKNFDFLIVCPRHYYKTINRIVSQKHPEIFIRTIKSNHDNQNGMRMYGDTAGWAKVFSEFLPEKIIKSKYKVLKFNQIEPDKLNE